MLRAKIYIALVLSISLSAGSNAQMVEFFGDSVQAQKGMATQLNFQVKGFSGISGMQGTLAYDTAELTFVGFGSFATLNPSLSAANFNFQSAADGWISFVWTDPMLSGASLPDSNNLFSIFFVAKGSVGALSKVHFIDTPTQRQVTDTTLTVRPSRFDSICVRISAPGNQNIITGNTNSQVYCAGDSLIVPYSATGSFGGSNVFRLEISDTAGSFVNSRLLSTGFINLIDTFRLRLPRDLNNGKVYRLRVSSSSPLVFGSDNGSDIVINELPLVSYQQNISICETDSPVILSGANPAGGSFSGNGVIQGRFDPSIAGPGSHIIQYSFTNSSSCSASASDTFEVFAKPAKPVISKTGDTLTSSALNGNQWFLNGMLITGATARQYIAQTNGLYSVIVSNGPCLSDSSEIVLVNTSTRPFAKSKAFVYPNPANNWLQIEHPYTEAMLRIYDAKAALIQEHRAVLSSELIDISALENGVYILCLQSLWKKNYFKISVIK